MNVINRNVVVLRPQQALLAWVNSHGESADKVSLNNAREDCAAYLIPEQDSPEEATEFLRSNFEELFRNELNGWYTDPKMHPTKLTWEMFQEWFDIELHSVVHDMGEDEICYEE